MRDPKEIRTDLEAIHDEMKKWFPHIQRDSARKKLEELEKKDAELEKELNKSWEEKYRTKLHLQEQQKDHDVTESHGKETPQQKSHTPTPNATK